MVSGDPNHKSPRFLDDPNGWHRGTWQTWGPQTIAKLVYISIYIYIPPVAMVYDTYNL